MAVDVEALTRRLKEAEDRIAALEARLASRGLSESLFTVSVGGKEVRLRALRPSEWIEVAGALPGFILALVRAEEGDTASLDEAMETAKRWIAASLRPGEEVDLETLTLPEAVAAITSIAEANGITEALKRFFRGGE